MPPTVLIVDDHAGFRGFARRLLEAGGFTVVGEAGDGASALAAVEALRPELVLLDVVLPDTDGFAVAEQLAENGDGPVVVLTSSREAADFGGRLERSPARGFIHKDDLSGCGARRACGRLAMSRRLLVVLAARRGRRSPPRRSRWSCSRRTTSRSDPTEQVAKVAIDAIWIVAGLIAWQRRPGTASGH